MPALSPRRPSCARLICVLCLAGAALARAQAQTPELTAPAASAAVGTGVSPAMAEALRASFERARQTLPAFLSALRGGSPDFNGFMARVDTERADEGRALWLVEVRPLPDGGLEGKVGPVTPGLGHRPGEVMRITPDRVIDWLFLDQRARRMRGNHSLCAILSQRPAEEAALRRAEARVDCPD